MKRNNRGFTVVELIVSIALLAIILVPVSGFFTNSFRIQSKTSMKTSITRVGQYIMENFKNKNYLEGELKNESNETFKSFVEKISLVSSGEGESLKYELKDESIKDNRSWKMKYKDVDYNVDISIPGFTTSDMSNFEIPDKDDCDGQVFINETGSFESVFAYNGGIEIHEIGGTPFINPIDGKEYSVNYPTIILKNAYPRDTKTTTLWIKNYYGTESESWKKIRIIKECKQELQVYIEGDNVSILKGQEGDGATSSQTRITSSYIGKEIEESKKSSSEILLDAKMIITKVNDDSIRDTFEFSFPVNYDYSKKGE